MSADAHAAFVTLALLFGAAAVALLYALVRQWGDRRAATIAAGLFTLAPALHFNSVVALSYSGEAAASIGVALLAWRAWVRPTRWALAGLGVAWAAAVGIRQSLFLFLLPVVLLGVVGWPIDWRGLPRRLAGSAIPSLAAALAWFLPMLWATGGFEAWAHGTAAQNREVVSADSVWLRGWPAVVEHAQRLGYYLHWEALWLVPLLALAAGMVAWKYRRRTTRGARAWRLPFFLAVWTGPALLFYLLVFDGWNLGPIGYVLTVLPALYAVAGLAVAAAFAGLPSLARPVRVAAAFGLPLLLVVSAAGLASAGDRLVRDEVQAHDDWEAGWQQLREAYAPNDTAILTWGSWAHVKWSFPEYLAWTYFPNYKVPGENEWALVFAMQHHRDEGRFIELYDEGPGRAHHDVPPWVKTVVVFDFQLAGDNGEPRALDPAIALREEHVGNGWRILVFEPDAAHPTVESLFTQDALGATPRLA